MSIPLFVSDKIEAGDDNATAFRGLPCLRADGSDWLYWTFEVLSRMPGTTVQIMGKDVEPVCDVEGLSAFAGCVHCGSANT